MKFGIGQSVTRKEDPRLLTGTGRYVDDVVMEGQAYAAFLRSPLAHAQITSLDTSAAEAAPGVLRVITARDPEIAAMRPIATGMAILNRDGSEPNMVRVPLMAADRVRYVGESVALVIAESPEAARDAAELIEIAYDELPAVTDPEATLEPSAPQLHDTGNLAFDWEVGDAAATDAVFAHAEHITRLRIHNPRVIVNAVEPRAINAQYDAESGNWTIWCSTQGTHGMRGQIAGRLGVDASRVRVLTPDVGGGFGMKLMIHPEYGLVAKAAELLGRPVKWTADRTESFLSDLQGRDKMTDAEAACTKDGRILAVRLTSWSNLGAYASQAAPGCHTVFSGDLASTVYDIGAIYNRVYGVFTTTTPVDAYRGAGRPEINYDLERLIDRVGAELGIDQIAIRLKNLTPPSRMPWTTALGVTFDSGDFPGILKTAAERADVAGFEARRADAARRGRYAGIGLISYMERTAGSPEENARVEIIPAKDGAPDRVRIWAGTQSTGQGHETAFAQLVHSQLGVPYESIEWVPGDSSSLPIGGGTGGSRSLIVASNSFADASNDLIEKARPGAAEALEADIADIEFHADEAGQFRIAGTDRTVTLFQAVAQMQGLFEGPGLIGEGFTDTGSESFPNGCHICEVEIDPETGALKITRYTAVDDFGTLVNPLLVTGQVQGGIVQGIGQALGEEAVCDASGQPLTGSYMDYRLPRTDDLPFIDVTFSPTPCQTNPLGIKGCGEAGSVASPQAVVNAALNALRPAGVDNLDMPLTPQKLWQAIFDANRRAAE